MNFNFVLSGFKNFKNNAKDIFNLEDILAVIALSFSLGLMLTRINKKIKSFMLTVSFLAAIPALIKTTVALFSAVSAAKAKYL